MPRELSVDSVGPKNALMSAGELSVFRTNGNTSTSCVKIAATHDACSLLPARMVRFLRLRRSCKLYSTHLMLGGCLPHGRVGAAALPFPFCVVSTIISDRHAGRGSRISKHETVNAGTPSPSPQQEALRPPASSIPLPPPQFAARRSKSTCYYVAGRCRDPCRCYLRCKRFSVRQYRLFLLNFVKLVLQVEDLAVASPATVSRAGMIFLDVDEMGWQPFVNSWLQQRYEHNKRGMQESTRLRIQAAWSINRQYLAHKHLPYPYCSSRQSPMPACRSLTGAF